MSAAMARETRRAMREKANRLGGTGSNDPGKPVDASSWRPPPALDAGRKTGARPLRSRIYKLGGKIQGDRAPRHAGKAPRGGYADGGRTGTGPLSMADVADENKRAKGSFHEGGYKRGGMPKAGHDMAAIKSAIHKHEKHDHKGEPLTKLAKGGKSGNWIAGAVKHPGSLHKSLGVPKGKNIPEAKIEKAEHSDNPKLAKKAHLAETLKGLHKAEGGKVDPAAREKAGTYYGGTRPAGGRMPKANGGRARGKTNINIVIAQPRGQQPQMPMQGPTRPPVLPPPQPPPQMGPPPAGGPGMPPGGPSPMMGGAPPMMRKAGGRTYRSAADMDAGALSGEGRLEKTRIAEKKYFRA